jgi:hypothetical protein
MCVGKDEGTVVVHKMDNCLRNGEHCNVITTKHRGRKLGHSTIVVSNSKSKGNCRSTASDVSVLCRC